ncbi:MAG TPA: rRNA maturation RNase YbeY [Actinomycetota bacterium]|nr:rRNA maturation RNase YbeY [Actinomycetota bacterium]
MSVFLANEQTHRTVDETGLVALARLVMRAEGVAESEVSILLVDPTVMAGLNARFMGEQRPTDVLSVPIAEEPPASGPPGGPVAPPGFAGGRGDDEDDREEGADEPWLLGDVVLCPAYAAEQAARAGQTLAAELELLTVHGILHLCGFDHGEPEEEQAMRARTDELLAEWRGRAQP